MTVIYEQLIQAVQIPTKHHISLLKENTDHIINIPNDKWCEYYKEIISLNIIENYNLKLNNYEYDTTHVDAYELCKLLAQNGGYSLKQSTLDFFELFGKTRSEELIEFLIESSNKSITIKNICKIFVDTDKYDFLYDCVALNIMQFMSKEYLLKLNEVDIVIFGIIFNKAIQMGTIKKSRDILLFVKLNEEHIISELLIQSKIITKNDLDSIKLNECCVCFKEINEMYVYDTCGHANVCKECTNKLVNKKCPSCNTKFSKCIKVFL
jgi:hypothetical protein